MREAQTADGGLPSVHSTQAAGHHGTRQLQPHTYQGLVCEGHSLPDLLRERRVRCHREFTPLGVFWPPGILQG